MCAALKVIQFFRTDFSGCFAGVEIIRSNAAIPDFTPHWIVQGHLALRHKAFSIHVKAYGITQFNPFTCSVGAIAVHGFAVIDAVGI